MPHPISRTLFVVVPGASQSPSHYGYLLHLLQSKGYPTLSALLPSTGMRKSLPSFIRTTGEKYINSQHAQAAARM